MGGVIRHQDEAYRRDEFLLRLFQREVQAQCQYIDYAASDLLRTHTDETLPGEVATPRVWFSVQAILVASATLSKLFWGSKGRRADQRKQLRDSLGIDDGSCLKSLAMRDDLEHVDERIECWFEEHRENPTLAAYEEAFGIYIAETGAVTFWNQSVVLNDLIFEARRILPIAKRESAKLWDTAI